MRLIFDGKSPALFTVNGVECIRGGQYNDIKPPYEHYIPESLNIEGFLRAVHRGEPISAQEYIANLDKSAGR